MDRELIIIGIGGAGLEALMVARRMKCSPWMILGFADDASGSWGRVIQGCEVLGGVEAVLTRFAGRELWFHCAIGNNQVRRSIAEACETAGLHPATLVDPTVFVADTAAIGAGTYVGPQSNLSPLAQVGKHVLINAQVSVGHHSIIGDFAQLCPGTRVSGHGRVGEGGLIGSNGVVAPSVCVGDWATLGAASFALRNIPDGATAVGNPARVMQR